MEVNDATLIRRTLEGDQNAFTVLVNKYQKRVHTLVWRKIGDFHIAEEITQDVFLKVYKIRLKVDSTAPVNDWKTMNTYSTMSQVFSIYRQP